MPGDLGEGPRAGDLGEVPVPRTLGEVPVRERPWGMAGGMVKRGPQRGGGDQGEWGAGEAPRGEVEVSPGPLRGHRAGELVLPRPA